MIKLESFLKVSVIRYLFMKFHAREINAEMNATWLSVEGRCPHAICQQTTDLIPQFL